MLIKALCDYYDHTAKNFQDKPEDYLSEQKVHYMIMLSLDGEIDAIQDIRDEQKVMKLPKRNEKRAIALNIIEHRPRYIFGLNYNKDKGFYQNDATDKAKKSNACFVKGNLEFCKDLSSPIVKAYCRFLEKWKPEEQCNNPLLMGIKSYNESLNCCFALSGHPEIMLHEDDELLHKFSNTDDIDRTYQNMMCPIEGKMLSAPNIHDIIKGIKGGKPFGTTLVSVNKKAFESFGKTQAFNSGISEKAVAKYTSTLNKLIADKNHRIYIGDVTIVFFAMSTNDENECGLFDILMGNSDKSTEQEYNNSLKVIAQEMISGRVADLAAFSEKASEHRIIDINTGEVISLNDINIDEDVIFYMAGFTSDGSRITQKFIYRNQFGKIIKNLIQHQQDIAMDTSGRQRYISEIYKQLLSPTIRNKKSYTKLFEQINPALSIGIFNSIINGTKYPESMLSTIVRRIKADKNTDEEKDIKFAVHIGVQRIGKGNLT